jgi:MFS family permease
VIRAVEDSTRLPILWPRVGAIATVQGAITLTWVIYALYLPQLLEQVGLSADLALTILIVEHLLEAVIEPVFGGLSDRTQFRLGHRFPLIILGVILASALFIALPAIAIFSNSTEIGAWLLPSVAIAWASAMAIFRSPALVLLAKTAPVEALPQAASLLTLSSQAIGAFRFVAYGFILSLGPGITFALGSMVLLGAIAFLRVQHPPNAPVATATPLPPVAFPWRAIASILPTALGIAWGLRFVAATVATALRTQLGESRSEWGLAIFFLTIAIASIPAGAIATRWGNAKAMIGGAIATMVGLVLVVGASFSTLVIWVVAIAISLAFSFVLNGAIPFVLGLVPSQQAGLGLGFYFGTFGAGMSFFDLLISLNQLSAFAVALMGVGALFIAALSIGLSWRFDPVQST